jgi:hypothetical protein
MKIIVILLLIIVITIFALLLKGIFSTREKYREGPIDTRLYYRSKCFSCEEDLVNRYGPSYAYLGQPTKGFAEEAELISRTGNIDAAYSAHPISF